MSNRKTKTAVAGKPAENKVGLEPLSGVRQSTETDNAVVACNDWLRIGSGRSLPKLLEQYREKSNFVKGFEAPSTSHTTLATWSSRFDWPARAREYDASWEQRKNAERESVISYGLALDYERLRKLYRLAEFLEGQIYERSSPDPITGVESYYNIWVRDVKSIGGGEYAERVDIERFNAPLLEQYRKVLEDIAKETGGRVQKQDITSAGEKLEVIIRYTDADS